MPVQTSYPGVYIEERPSGVHTIAGVSTSVTAFVGAAAQGPADRPVRCFSFADFVRTFGAPIDESAPLGYAVSHFFGNGGSQAVVVRALAGDAAFATATLKSAESTPRDVLVLTAGGKGAWANRVGGRGLEVETTRTGTANDDDLFNLVVTQHGVDPKTNATSVVAREEYRNLSMSPAHPRYALTAVASSLLVTAALPTTAPTTTAKGKSVGASTVANPLTITSAGNRLRVAVDWGPAAEVSLFVDDVAGGASVDKTPAAIAAEIGSALATAGLGVNVTEAAGTITIESTTTGMNSAVTVTPAAQSDLSQALHLGLAFGGTETSGAANKRPADIAGAPAPFAGGSDGSPLTAGDVVPGTAAGGLFALGDLRFPRFNILCLPGLTSADSVPISAALAYAKQERAFFVVDSPKGGFSSLPTQAPNLGSIQALGEHGGIYYPRLQQAEALAGGTTRMLDLPACGAVAGVMARIDSSRGVWKAPAGIEAGVVGASGLTRPTDDSVSGVLNPAGINVLRSFPGVGIVVWGARTLKGDDAASSEFKYVPIRRLTDYIASSLYLGTQFAVFEPNDPDLWAQLRLAVGTFMRRLFRQGAFQQSSDRTESKSFFVVCDETVNPQSEIDLGRVNVVVGFAPLKPAEFVVITITQISQLEE